MRILAWGVAAIAVVANLSRAQSARELVARGDSAHAAFASRAALQLYEEALAVEPTSYEALWKASRDAADLAEFDADKKEQEMLFTRGESFARRAVAADSSDAEAHFALARALGLSALTVGIRQRVKHAEEIRAEAVRALAIDSTHAGALHVLGKWNAEVMRLNGIERLIARNFLGGKTMGSANWADATRYLEMAVRVDPSRLVHHLDLARIYADTGERAKARAEYERVLAGPRVDVNDGHYQEAAKRELAKLRS
jgi:tetratricopeptide (TPR) repeat protein